MKASQTTLRIMCQLGWVPQWLCQTVSDRSKSLPIIWFNLYVFRKKLWRKETDEWFSGGRGEWERLLQRPHREFQGEGTPPYVGCYCVGWHNEYILCKTHKLYHRDLTWLHANFLKNQSKCKENVDCITISLKGWGGGTDLSNLWDEVLDKTV